VNIATFHLGRAGQGNDAIALLQVDQALDPSVVEAVSNLPNIVQVKQLAF
jgi:D-3-phosphoglycerate dehydrogenase